MTSSRLPTRYRAISMELAAYLDEHCVEMHTLTEDGQAISVACPTDSIFAVLRHIKRLGIDCPEIATWGTTGSTRSGRA